MTAGADFDFWAVRRDARVLITAALEYHQGGDFDLLRRLLGEITDADTDLTMALVQTACQLAVAFAGTSDSNPGDWLRGVFAVLDHQDAELAERDGRPWLTYPDRDDAA